MKNLEKKVAEAKVIIKRHGGFNLIGKYYKTDEQKEEYLKNYIEWAEIQLQAAKEMLEGRDFH